MVATYLALFLFFSSSGWAQPIIKKIELRGLKRVSAEEVYSLLTVKEGDKLSQLKIDEDIKTLYRSGKFRSVVQLPSEPFEDGIKLIFEFEENPIIEAITIFGNRELSAKEIKEALPLKEGDFLPVYFEFLITTKISQLYAEKKIYQTQTTLHTSAGKEKDAVVLSIYINEGRRLLIKDLLFRGNKSFSSRRLRLLVANRGSWWFLKNYYNDETFEEDLNAIREFYRQRGFLDVDLRRGEFLYNEAENWVSPVIEIEEGVRYKVSDIEPRGYRIFRRDEILKLFEPMRGRYYSGKRFFKGFQKLGEMYGDEGFILMEVRPEYIREAEIGEVKILLNIEENPRVYVGDIKIDKEEFEVPLELSWLERWYQRLAPPVKEEVIEKELLLKPGDVYRRYKEVRSAERLRRLGIFDEVSIRRDPTEKKDVMNMIVSLKEGVTAALVFGVGYGDVTGAYIQAMFRERNLFGEAKDLDISAMLGTRLLALHIGYLDRYFRGTRTSFRAELYRDVFRREGYDEITLGGQTEFGIPINEYLRHYIRLRAEYVDFKDVDEDIETKIEAYPVGAVRYRIVYDSRDDIGWPTRGELKSAGIELGYADGALVKFTGSYAGYWRVYRDLVYALDSQLGFMPFDAHEVGIGERFFMGGSNDLRGFDYRGAGPHDKGEDDVPTGGAVKLLVRNEMRFPLYEKLRGLVFIDVGTIDDSFPGPGSPRASAGLGFRYDIKLFFIALDFAHAFLREDEDQTRFVHFSIGSLF